MNEANEKLLGKLRARWREEDLAEGRAEGEAKGRLATVLKMLKKGVMSLEDIAECGDMSLTDVQRLAAQAQ